MAITEDSDITHLFLNVGILIKHLENKLWLRILNINCRGQMLKASMTVKIYR